MKLSKIITWRCVLLFLICSSPVKAELGGLAIIRYSQDAPPASSEALFYIKANKSPIFLDLKLSNGETPRYYGRPFELVPYPPASGVDSEAIAAEEVERIQGLIRLYPKHADKLQAVLSRWQQVQAEQHQKAEADAASGIHPLPWLEIEGTRYKNVTAQEVKDRKVTISHSDGIATISLDKLTPQQVAALNRTNDGIHIDPKAELIPNQKEEDERRAWMRAVEESRAQAQKNP